MVRGVGPAMWIFQQFPAMQAIALKMPPWLAPRLSEPLGQVISMQMHCAKQIEDTRRRMASGSFNKNERPNIFTELLDPEKQDGWPVPSTWDLKDECFSLLAAAADTTGNAMTIAAYRVMDKPTIYARLRNELIDAFPADNFPLKFTELEKLPYLTGVVKEGIRLSFGVIGRLPRVVPLGGATFNGHFLPEGNIVSMSSWLMHRNPDIFPDPMLFNPDRWLDPVDFRKCDSHIVAFGKGSRQCVGMPLAYAELYIAIGSLFRRFDQLQVHETTQKDLVYDDYFSSYNLPGKRWLKAVGPEMNEERKLS